jgi:beta-barrel assembly-enhancing protease
MRRQIFSELVAAIVLFGLILLIIWYIPWKKKDSEIISIAKEQEIGEKLFDYLTNKDKNFELIKDDYTDSIIQIISHRLLDNKDFNYEYRFEVFNNSMINAFTLPGGIIVISAGLLEFADSPEEVAAVIAHEMGHVENRDVITRLIRELSINILLSQDTYVISEVAKSLSSNSYSRKQETAADDFALKTLDESNIEPRILATFFRKIKEKEGDLPPYLEAFSSHPNFSSRITHCLEYKPGDDFVEDDFDMNWEEVKGRLSERK